MEVTEILLDYGADLRPRDERGYNALMLAGLNGKNEIARLLLTAGAEVGLMEAALLGDRTEVQSLLLAGADLHTQDTANAIRWASIGGHADVVTLLLDSDTPIDAPDDCGKTALMLAALHGRLETMRLLLERGANPNTADSRGGTALMQSLEGLLSGSQRHREAVELLLSYGARANARSHSGWTPLMLACLSGHTDIVGALLQHGADPNLFTDAEIMEREEGCSTTNALMMAIGGGAVEVIKALLQYGADPLAGANVGRTALDSARRRAQSGYRQTEMQEILSLLEAAVNER